MDKKKWFVIALDLVAVAAAFAAVPLTGWMFRSLPDCLSMRVGLLCPACGGTRCVRYFFGGQLGAAFLANPFFFVLIWYLSAALVLLNVGVLFGVEPAQRIAKRMTDWHAVIVAAVLFAIFGVARNLW
ncbi:MAG: DUF2752 domain-containing protein [Oscillospiraceae bacterium]|nr:DUF2752 domain-containing protein [Oscillospiraceae bacterium]